MTDEDWPLLGEWATDNPYRGALLIPVDPLGRVLLQLRDHGPGTVHPGKWSLFGGGADPGETQIQTMVREFEEEVGICLDPDTLTPVVRALSSPGRRRLFVFTATLSITPADICLGEGAGFGFIRPEDIEALDLIPFARNVLRYWLAG